MRAPAARRCCSWARRWATRAAASPGIAFTAERTLHGWGPPYAATSVRPEGWAEQSGTIVHGALATLGIEAETVLWNVVPGASAPARRAALEPHARGRRAARGRRGAGRADRAPAAARDRRRGPQRRARARRARPGLRRARAPPGQRRRDGLPRRPGLARAYGAVGALMVPRVPDRRAQRERAQHQHERECRRSARSRRSRRPACRPRTRAAGRRSPRR